MQTLWAFPRKRLEIRQMQWRQFTERECHNSLDEEDFAYLALRTWQVDRVQCLDGLAYHLTGNLRDVWVVRQLVCFAAVFHRNLEAP